MSDLPIRWFLVILAGILAVVWCTYYPTSRYWDFHAKLQQQGVVEVDVPSQWGHTEYRRFEALPNFEETAKP